MYTLYKYIYVIYCYCFSFLLIGLGDVYLALATETLQERLVKLAIAYTEKAIYFLTK